MSLNRNLINSIQAEAANLGFSLFGISNPLTLEKSQRYLNWLDRGFQGSMEYLSRSDSVTKRFSPNFLVKDCRTVISLGFSYPLIHFQEIPDSSTSGWISSYAVFEDYHNLLKKRAEKLIENIKPMVRGTHSFRVYTDSAPILEREFGVLGNIGWIGKNANLISPMLGSCFLLAEILTDFEMDPETMRTPDRCGKCRRCMDACPTQCIQPDRTIDARKCISYLTIENKGEIPLDLRGKIGQWVFGCDVCQMVCPWNYHSMKNVHQKFKNKIQPTVILAEQLAFTEDQFKQYFSRTPVLRASWLGYTRNLVIAAGNLSTPENLLILVQILHNHPSPMIRSHAAWALGKYGNDASMKALSNAIDSEMDAAVQVEIHMALE